MSETPSEAPATCPKCGSGKAATRAESARATAPYYCASCGFYFTPSPQPGEDATAKEFVSWGPITESDRTVAIRQIDELTALRARCETAEKERDEVKAALRGLMPFVLEDYYPDCATPEFKAAVENANELTK